MTVKHRLSVKRELAKKLVKALPRNKSNKKGRSSKMLALTAPKTLMSLNNSLVNKFRMIKALKKMMCQERKIWLRRSAAGSKRKSIGRHVRLRKYLRAKCNAKWSCETSAKSKSFSQWKATRNTIRTRISSYSPGSKRHKIESATSHARKSTRCLPNLKTRCSHSSHLVKNRSSLRKIMRTWPTNYT